MGEEDQEQEGVFINLGFSLDDALCLSVADRDLILRAAAKINELDAVHAAKMQADKNTAILYNQTRAARKKRNSLAK